MSILEEVRCVECGEFYNQLLWMVTNAFLVLRTRGVWNWIRRIIFGSVLKSTGLFKLLA